MIDGPLPAILSPRSGVLAASVCTSRFLGVPFFDPPIRATTLFNPWAYLFGPLFFFACGLWRKGLVLSLLWCLCTLPTLFGPEGPLTRILLEEYAPLHLGLTGLAQLFVVLYGMGHRFYASLTAILFSALFLGSEPYIQSLSLGFCTAFVWLNSGLVWQALARVFLFSLLGKRWLAALSLCGGGAALWQLGLPRLMEVYALPAVAFPVFCGLMGTYDLYRKRSLHQTFWW